MTVESVMAGGDVTYGTSDAQDVPGHTWLDSNSSPAAVKVQTDTNPPAYVEAGGAAVAAHVAESDPHTQYQKESEKNVVNGYAGLSSVDRTTKGVDTTDYLIVDLATKGLVIKDTAGTPHYWLLGVTTLGVLTTTDLGTTKP